MADDWLTDTAPPEAASGGGDDWLTDGAPGTEAVPAAAAALAAAVEDHTGQDDDWLTTTLAFGSAEVSYGSPCGWVAPLWQMYWCQDSRRVISEECTVKEIHSFLSPDCNQTYAVEQAEMFENKSLNSFECPQCPCTLSTFLEDGKGYYLRCSFCRWDSTSLIVEGRPFVDEKPDQLILRLMKLEKQVGTDVEMKRLLVNLQKQLAPPSPAERGFRTTLDAPVDDRGEWSLGDLEQKLAESRSVADEQPVDTLRSVFDMVCKDGAVDRDSLSKLASEMRQPLTPAALDAALKEMDVTGTGTVNFEQLNEWWHDQALIEDAQRYNAKLDEDPAVSSSLQQRFTQPSAQPELVRQLLPRRKALLPRLARRSMYSDRIVVQPSKSDDAVGAPAKHKADRQFDAATNLETERQFDLVQLGIEQIPQLYVAELPDAEEMRSRPTTLMLTVTNPLDTECTLRFRDCAVAAGLADGLATSRLPGEPAPGKHRARGDTDIGVNAKLSMMDGKPFVDLQVGSKRGAGTSADADADGASSFVVKRSGNRVTVQFLIQHIRGHASGKAQTGSAVKCALHCELSTPDDPVVDGERVGTHFTTYFTFSLAGV